MNDLKSTLYVMLIFLIAAAPLYYFSGQGMEAITGMATSESSAQANGGEYRIMPDFTVDVKDSLADYTTLRTAARKLVTDVQGCTDSTGKCVEKSLPQGWSTDCGTAEERLFSSMVEGYLLCTQSEDNYCACEIPVTFAETYKGQDHEIVMDTDADLTLFSMGDLNMDLPLQTGLDLSDDGILKATANTHRSVWDIGFSDVKVKRAVLQHVIIPEDGLDWYLANVGAFTWLDLETVPGQKLDYSSDSRFILYKSPGSRIFISPEERASLSLRTCQPANKRTYKFCVDTKKASEMVTYRFALDFSDSIVPAQPSFAVADTKLSRQSLTVSFTPSADKDIDHYDIFCSKEQFTSVDAIPVALRVVAGPVQLTACPEQEKNMPIIDGTTHFISVIAVDASNNYHKTGIQTQTAVSVDDTVPPTTI